MKRLSGFKVVDGLPPGEKTLFAFEGTIIVATTKGLYIIEGDKANKLEAVPKMGVKITKLPDKGA